jgi:hypothetical protein
MATRKLSFLRGSDGALTMSAWSHRRSRRWCNGTARPGLDENDTAIALCCKAAAAYRALGDNGDDLARITLTLASWQERTGDREGALVSFRDAHTLFARLNDPEADQVAERLAALESEAPQS